MAVLIDPLGVLTSPLTRLNFFDGMFLRAELLRREQSGIRNLVFRSNVADGRGIAFGLDASIAGDTITVSPGLAVDGQGRIVLLVDRAEASLADLLATGDDAPAAPKRRDTGRPGGGSFEECVDVPAPPRGVVVDRATLHAVVVRHHESACGWEEVRGRACEDACDASVERPYLVESGRIALCPVTLGAALPGSQAVELTDRHLRSRVAAAFFADERAGGDDLVSNARLRNATWCRGATAPGGICGDDVPVALVAVRGGAVVFVDPWTVRRERMETPPRRYWAGRVRMRPWDVYVAQSLQFQCQLDDALGGSGGLVGTPVDPCADARDVVGETLSVLDVVRRDIRDVSAVPRLAAIGGLGRLDALGDRLRDVLKPAAGPRRLLVDGGIVETPPAGWLPVDRGVPVIQQVADLLGPGVELRLCGVRADQAAGEFEACQHLDRISLVRGIDDPGRREMVDVLVPDGEVGAAPPGMLFEVDLAISPRQVVPRERLHDVAAANRLQIPLRGVARLDAAPAGPFALYGAFAGGVPALRNATAANRFMEAALRGERLRRTPNFGERAITDPRLRRIVAATRTDGMAVADADGGEGYFAWLEIGFDGNPVTAGRGSGGRCLLDVRVLNPMLRGLVATVEASGRYTVQDVQDDGTVVVAVDGVATRGRGGTDETNEFSLTFEIDVATGTVQVTGAAALRAAWDGSPVAAEVGLRVPGAHLSVGATGQQSDAAGQRGNAYHERALAALTVLDAHEGGFAGDASAKLFGARGGVASITTPHDWVLFRRRVRYDCWGPEAPAARDGEAEVWHLLADGRPHGERVVAALRTGDFDSPWTRLATARFVGDTAQLRTTRTELHQAWGSSEVSGGDVVLFGGYAGTGPFVQAADRDRLRNLVDALRPAAVLEDDPAASLALLGPPPAPFLRSGSDAAVFLVSLRTARASATCAEVFTAADRGDGAPWEAALAPDETAVERLLDAGQIVRLGTIERDEDGTYTLANRARAFLASELALGAAVWLRSDADMDDVQANAFATDGIGPHVRELQVTVLVEDFQFERDPCPMRIFLHALPGE